MGKEKKWGDRHISRHFRKDYQEEIENKCKALALENNLRTQTCKEYLSKVGIHLKGTLYKLGDLDENSYNWILNVIKVAEEKIVAPINQKKERAEAAKKQEIEKPNETLDKVAEGAKAGAQMGAKVGLENVTRGAAVTVVSTLGIPIQPALIVEATIEGGIMGAVSAVTTDKKAVDDKKEEVQATIKEDMSKEQNESNKNESITAVEADSKEEQSAADKSPTLAPKSGEDTQMQILLQLTKQIEEQSKQVEEQSRKQTAMVLHTLGLPIGGLVGYLINQKKEAPIAANMYFVPTAMGYAISTIIAGVYYYSDSIYAYAGAGYLLAVAATGVYNLHAALEVAQIGLGCIILHGFLRISLEMQSVFYEFVLEPLVLNPAIGTIKAIAYNGYYVVVSSLEETKEVDMSFIANLHRILGYENYQLIPARTSSLKNDIEALKAAVKSKDTLADLQRFLNYRGENGLICEVAGEYLDAKDQRLFYKEIKRSIEYLPDWTNYAKSFVVTPEILKIKKDMSNQCLNDIINTSGQTAEVKGFVPIFEEHPWYTIGTGVAAVGSAVVVSTLGGGIGLSIIPPLLWLRSTGLTDHVLPSSAPSAIIEPTLEAIAFARPYFKDNKCTGIKSGLLGVGVGAVMAFAGEIIKCTIEGCSEYE